MHQFTPIAFNSEVPRLSITLWSENFISNLFKTLENFICKVPTTFFKYCSFKTAPSNFCDLYKYIYNQKKYIQTYPYSSQTHARTKIQISGSTINFDDKYSVLWSTKLCIHWITIQVTEYSTGIRIFNVFYVLYKCDIAGSLCDKLPCCVTRLVHWITARDNLTGFVTACIEAKLKYGGSWCPAAELKLKPGFRDCNLSRISRPLAYICVQSKNT